VTQVNEFLSGLEEYSGCPVVTTSRFRGSGPRGIPAVRHKSRTRLALPGLGMQLFERTCATVMLQLPTADRKRVERLACVSTGDFAILHRPVGTGPRTGASWPDCLNESAHTS